MENKIKSILQPGETVKWSGRPEDVKLLEAPYGTSFVIRAVSAVLIAALGVFLAFFGVNDKTDPTQMMIFMLVCLVVALYLVLDPIYVMNKLKKSTFYIYHRPSRDYLLRQRS